MNIFIDLDGQCLTFGPCNLISFPFKNRDTCGECKKRTKHTCAFAGTYYGCHSPAFPSASLWSLPLCFLLTEFGWSGGTRVIFYPKYYSLNSDIHQHQRENLE